MLTLFITLALFTSTPSTQQTNVAPKQTAFIFKDQQSVYNLPPKKRGRK